MTEAEVESVRRSFAARFGSAQRGELPRRGLETVATMAGRGSCRNFRQGSVDPALVEFLCGIALSSPTKSDLQQRDIIIVRDGHLRHKIDALTGQDWVAQAPTFLVFCGNNRRQRQIHEWREHPFANDHLDAFFNAVLDAGIALSACVTAAEAVGLGCCPVSTIRNHAGAVSELLALPDHVFPVAGLALGWPEVEDVEPSMRLPLRVTVHVDRFSECNLRTQVEDYDRRRDERQPYARHRRDDIFGVPEGAYTWSEDKARQYAHPERPEFGAFIRAKGFRLD